MNEEKRRRRAERRAEQREKLQRHRAAKGARGARGRFSPPSHAVLATWIRWAAREVFGERAYGVLRRAERVTHEEVDDVVDRIADEATRALDFGASPIADHAERLLDVAIDESGRGVLHVLIAETFDVIESGLPTS